MRCILKEGDKMKDGGFVCLLPDFSKRSKHFRRNVDMKDVGEFIKHIQVRNYIPYVQSIITEDGDPITVSGIPAYYLDDALLDDIPKRQQKEVMAWIKNNIYERKTPNHMYHTYRLKHIIQWDTGIYLTENQFKDAMLRSGYMPVDRYDSSWIFNIGFVDTQKIDKLERQGRFIP